MNNIQSSSVAIPARGAVTTAIAEKAPVMAVFVFGLIALYCAGFSSFSAAHNATHDSRHSSGFPCH